MPIPFWAGHYIGLPFKEHGRDRSGADCWGLVRLVLAEQFSIALPSFAAEYRRTTDTEHISKLIERETPGWKDIPAGEEECADVIVMLLRGRPMHVGLVLGDGHMLHIENGINSAIERYRGPRWAERVSGFYRYRKYFDDDDTTADIFTAPY